MRRFLILFLLLPCGFLMGQPLVPDFKYGLKVSNQMSLGWHEHSVVNPNQVPVGYLRLRKMDLLQAIPAFMWQTHGSNFNELSITQLGLQRQEAMQADFDGVLYKGTQTYYGTEIKFAHLHRFFKSNVSRWQILLALEASPYVRGSRFRPTMTSSMANRMISAGLKGELRPRLIWMPRSHYFMEIGLGMTIFDTYYNNSHIADPALTPAQQSAFTYNWTMFTGEYALHIGAGLKLNWKNHKTAF